MKKILTPMIFLALAVTLSSCGNRGTLEPPKGQSLPSGGLGQADPISGEDMIAPSTQSQPERSDELLRRSEKRQDDKFDLPPPG